MSPEEIARAEKALAENDRQADENARFLKLKPEIMGLFAGLAANTNFEANHPIARGAVCRLLTAIEGKE